MEDKSQQTVLPQGTAETSQATDRVSAQPTGGAAFNGMPEEVSRDANALSLDSEKSMGDAEPYVPKATARPKVSLATFAKGLVVVLLVLSALGLGGSLLAMKTADKNTLASSSPAGDLGSRFNTIKLSPDTIAQANSSLSSSTNSNVIINGSLELNNGLIITPSLQPTGAVPGQIYYNQTTNVPYYYNGSQFVSLAPAPQGVTSLGGSSGTIGLGNGLTVSGNQLAVSGSLLQSLTAATGGVLSLNSLVGSLSLNNSSSSGSAITIENAVADGATKGIAAFNATNFSSSAGVIDTIQDIAINSTPTFGGLTLSAALSVSNGGTGNTGFTANGIVYGNGSNNIQVTAAAGDSILATDSNNIPTLVQTLPLVVQGNITEVGALDGGSITAGFGAISTNSDIATTAALSGGTLSVGSGNPLQIDSSGDLTTTGNATIQGNTGLTVGVANSTAGNLNLANINSNWLVTIQGLNPSGAGNAIVQVPSIPGGTTDTFCLFTLANCATAGNTVTGTGTAGTLSEFNGPHSVTNSPVTDSGTALTINGEGLIAGTITASTLQAGGTLTIIPSGTLTVGATNQKFVLQGNSNSVFTASAGGNVTTLGFITPTATQTINFPNAGGTVCLQGSSSCGFALTASGVTTLDGIAGGLSIVGSTGSGTNITLQDASTSQLGVSEFNSTNFTVSSGVVNTIQSIATGSTVQFGGLGIGTAGTSGNITLTSGHTVFTSTLQIASGSSGLTINGSTGGSANITFENDNGSGGTNTFLFPTTGGSGQTICTSALIGCGTSSGGQAVLLEPGSVQTASANTNSIFVNKASGTGNLLELQTGGTDALAINNSGTTTIKTGSVTSGFTVSGTLTTNTISPTATLTIGSTSQTLTLQGSATSTITATGGGALTEIGFAVGTGASAPQGNVIYQFQNNNTISAGTYTVCTTAGNCSGSGGTITGSGTASDIAQFTASGNVGNSIISDSSTTATVGGNLTVGVSGASALTLGIGSSASGTLVFDNSTNNNATTLSLAAAPGSAIALKLPDVSGTFADSASSPLSLNTTTGALTCTTCLTTTTGVISLEGLFGALTLNNSSGSGSAVTINNAAADGSTKGIAAFNSTNFSASSGVINTIQNISTSSSPTFSNLTIQGSTGATLGNSSNLGQLSFKDGTSDGFTSAFSPVTLSANRNITIPDASGTLAVSVNGGNLTLSAAGQLGFTNSPNFSGTATINTLSVTTIATTATLNVTGVATVASLTVTGNAQFDGNITVNGHIITSGGQPSAVAQTAAGSGASASISGDDTTGTVTVTTGSSPAAGDLVDITFSSSYGSAPHVIISGQDGTSAASFMYPAAKSPTGFELRMDNMPQANTTYTFDYFVAR